MNATPMPEADTFWGRCGSGTQGIHGAPHWDHRDCCSFCGSMRPSLALAAIRAGATVVPTDKNYKIYINDWPPGMASPNPAGKCYLNHFSEAQAVEFVELDLDGKMKIATPGHFYRGMCWGVYKEAISKLFDDRKAAESKKVLKP